jgi:hypothetical protein
VIYIQYNITAYSVKKNSLGTSKGGFFMLRAELKELRLLKAICQQFPDAEIIRRDGSRKKLTDIFGLATDTESRPAMPCQSKKSCHQLLFDFANNGNGQERGAT